MLVAHLLPASFAALLTEFRPVLTSASFVNFQVLVYGWLHALGRGRVTDALRAATSIADKHFSAYFRFFSRATWCLDEFGLTLLAVAVRLLRLTELVIVLDDTLMRKTGKKIAHAGMHADPVLRCGNRPFMSYGHVFVVLALHVSVAELGRTGWALPFMFRLFEPGKRGGRADAPSDQRRAASRRRRGASTRERVRKTDREVVDGEVRECTPCPEDGPLPEGTRKTKLQLAAEAILVVARRFPELRITVVADHLYNGAAVLRPLHEEVSNVRCVMRGRADAALYDLPPPRAPGQRGRSAVKGARLQNPKQWAQDHAEAFAPAVVDLYGHDVPLLVASYVGIPYRSLPGRLVRYVIVRDPNGIYADQYLFTTDPSTPAEEVVRLYGLRWPLERTFQDSKQKLGIEDSEAQLPAAVRRTAPFGMALYSLVVLWFVTGGHREAAALEEHRDPWYRKDARPSFSDMLAALRRLGWARALTDPASGGAPRQKSLRAYLARVVAAA